MEASKRRGWFMNREGLLKRSPLPLWERGRVRGSIYTFLIFSLFLSGCASVQTQQEWERVRAFATERTGIETHWEQTEDDVKVKREEVNKLLSDGLTEDDAVRIALVNNKALQSTFEEIGIARVGLLQARY